MHNYAKCSIRGYPNPIYAGIRCPPFNYDDIFDRGLIINNFHAYICMCASIQKHIARHVVTCMFV